MSESVANKLKAIIIYIFMCIALIALFTPTDALALDAGEKAAQTTPSDDGIVWEIGTFTQTRGKPNENGGTPRRMRMSEIVTAQSAYTLHTDGQFSTKLVIFDDDDVVTEVYGYDTQDKLILNNKRFRIVIADAADDKAALNGYDSAYINEHVKLIEQPLPAEATLGLKWCAMGDSITAGSVSFYSEEKGKATSAVRRNECWATRVAFSSYWDLTNIAKGGTGFIKDANNDDTHTTSAWYIARHTNFIPYDIVTVAYGINDYKGDRPLGSIADDAGEGEPYSIYSGIKAVIEAIRASNPECRIVFITPFNAVGYSSEPLGDYLTEYALNYRLPNSGTLLDVRDAIIECCALYGVDCIDETTSDVINPDNITTLLEDGVHPNAAGHRLIADELLTKLVY